MTGEGRKNSGKQMLPAALDVQERFTETVLHWQSLCKSTQTADFPAHPS
jgi:hypothetical protein